MTNAQKKWLAEFVILGTMWVFVGWVAVSVIDVWCGCQMGIANAFVLLESFLK